MSWEERDDSPLTPPMKAHPPAILKEIKPAPKLEIPKPKRIRPQLDPLSSFSDDEENFEIQQ